MTRVAKVIPKRTSASKTAPASAPAPDGLVLTIDVGNTHTVLGVFSGAEVQDHFRLTSTIPRTGDELRPLVEALIAPFADGLRRSRRSILASVVPSVTPAWEALVQRLLGAPPIVVSPRLDLGVALDVPDPDSVGADRVANSVAAAAFHRLPAIVVDLGTTTNFDVVLDRPPRYVGGAIALGILTSSEELFRRGARLAKVEIRRPAAVVGRTTQECLQSGVFFGAVGQIDGLVTRISKELRIKPTVIATGGLAEAIARDSATITAVDPTLTLRGLAVIEARVRGRRLS